MEKYNDKKEPFIIWILNIARVEAIETLQSIPYHNFSTSARICDSTVLNQPVKLELIESIIIALRYKRQL